MIWYAYLVLVHLGCFVMSLLVSLIHSTSSKISRNFKKKCLSVKKKNEKKRVKHFELPSSITISISISILIVILAIVILIVILLYYSLV